MIDTLSQLLENLVDIGYCEPLDSIGFDKDNLEKIAVFTSEIRVVIAIKTSLYEMLDCETTDTDKEVYNLFEEAFPPNKYPEIYI